jgi:hypothetical protein
LKACEIKVADKAVDDAEPEIGDVEMKRIAT